MIKVLTAILTLLTIHTFGQENLTEEAQAIVAEGKLLYKSEMASWYGTDVFLENYKEREKIGGYFSYTENDTAKCIFFSKTENPKVIGTISFDSTYNVKTAKTDLTERDFSAVENDLYQIRENAMKELMSNTDELFLFYENTNPNIIPIINGQEKKVYILTAPQQNGIVIFGNDYLLTFNQDNKLLTKKHLHKNIIPIEFGNTETGEKVQVTMHSHLPETGNYITATDICTLMLYEKFTTWESHNVVSKKYMNIWNCQTNELTVIPMSTVEKINDDQKKRNKKKEKDQ